MAKAGDDDYNRALDCVDAGQLQEAIEAVESALMSDAKDGGYWQLYSILLIQAGRAEDAEKAKVKASEFGLGEVDALLIKAAGAAAEKNWNKAVTACEQALDLAPDSGEVWTSYAANLIEGGYRKDALKASATAVELIPDEGQLWYLRGRILRLSEKLVDAEEAFGKAVAIEPKLAVAWYEKGMVEYQTGAVKEARQSFLQAKALGLKDPSLEEALKIVGEA